MGSIHGRCAGGGASAADVAVSLDEDGSAPRTVHAFILKAHSPVFRRMLDGSMTEATERIVNMKGVSPSELEDFLSCLYQLAVPKEVQESEARLIVMLSMADRYEILALKD